MTFATPPPHNQNPPHCLTAGFKGVFGLTRQASCDLYPEVWIQFGILSLFLFAAQLACP